jgi:hypothetical protein
MRICALISVCALVELSGLHADGAVVTLTMTGTVDTLAQGSEGRGINIGDPWLVSLQYDYPTPRIDGTFPGLYSFIGIGHAWLDIGASALKFDKLNAFVDTDRPGVGPQGLSIRFSSLTPGQPPLPSAPPPFLVLGSTGVFMFTDQTLPSSPAEWDLLLAEDFLLRATVGTPVAPVKFESHVLATAVYAIIPEPVTAAMMLLGLTLLRRRCRW